MSSTPRQRERLARIQNGICLECELPLPADLAGTEVDHIVPRCRGGPDLPWNRRLVHFKCNRSKRFKLTAEAAALAAEHGIVLHEPPVPRNWRRPWLDAPAGRPGALEQRIAQVEMFPRKCHGCGCFALAITDDSEVRVLCDACYQAMEGVEESAVFA